MLRSDSATFQATSTPFLFLSLLRVAYRIFGFSSGNIHDEFGQLIWITGSLQHGYSMPQPMQMESGVTRQTETLPDLLLDNAFPSRDPQEQRRLAQR
ncbi:MAG: hypothetical protein ABSA57_00020 [Candidatus Acidiferrales bacterium]